ncbi:MAG: DNA polymerase III subunit epsilon [Zetaproteobacteria bacterium CG12_big_fil_rev_8_21_14_0_65_54_13]|nr:MAG: DNA polymerase III subunit epsilon [Zetaproteobacteria bacterium CG12_big_fil_rev_8_21_14_0_65_54_13]PIX55648.1 MAG: DNA polymerase III subunit epsilon [Zetaproteobacteria bacterium CG_4_10_14_3_um_filter_54_28]PJA30656.1 MAG: DNA polymerase III subunit epsilon [Zetaproteobacteria bacterium CG_4_9_14_3_um_filter_54_145]
MRDEDAVRHLQQSDNYRVLERLQPPACYGDGEPATPRIGLVIDTETTGLDTATDKIIELGFVAFAYDAGSGRIYNVLHSYDGFEDPGEPLNEVVKNLTGISDDMVAGQQLDDAEIERWLGKADLIIAHNAGFDRQMLERRLPLAVEKNWACTFNDIDWQAEGISSLKLDYIAYRLGYFFDGHRAVIDAQATLHLLSRALPVSGRPAMSLLLEKARENRRRLFAVGAPFDKKDELRARGYRWLADVAMPDRYGKQKKGVWSRVVAGPDIESEEQWLQTAIYAGKAGFVARDITARDRYSVREFHS